MAWGVDEGQQSTIAFGLIGADVLGDSTGLIVDDVGVPNLVEQLGLAVVNVSHDGNDWWANRSVVVVVVVHDVEQLEQLNLLLLARVDHADLDTQVGREQFDHVVGQGLGGRDHLSLLHEEADDVGRRTVQSWTEVLSGTGTFDHNLALGHGGVLRRVGRQVHRLEFLTATPTTSFSAWWTATARSTAGTTTGRATGTTTGTTTGSASTGTTAGTTTRSASTGTSAGAGNRLPRSPTHRWATAHWGRTGTTTRMTTGWRPARSRDGAWRWWNRPTGRRDRWPGWRRNRLAGC